MSRNIWSERERQPAVKEINVKLMEPKSHTIVFVKPDDQE